jgi:hypothetical protein
LRRSSVESSERRVLEAEGEQQQQDADLGRSQLDELVGDPHRDDPAGAGSIRPPIR